MKFLSAIIFLFMLVGCDSRENLESHSKEVVDNNLTVTKKRESKSNILTLTDIDSKSYQIQKQESGFKFKNLENRVILLDFFATWCPPCRAEIPHLVNIKANFKDEFEIISVLTEDEKSNGELKDFRERNGINYIILNSENNKKLAKWVGGVRSLPFMVMYDKNGEYFTHYIGAVPEEMIVSDLERALKK